MKGLMIKDLYCLRRKMTIWGITVLMTSIVCVMFIFSAKYGTLAKAFDEMRALPLPTAMRAAREQAERLLGAK